jgi:hydrogenase expression/formation protein HypE
MKGSGVSDTIGIPAGKLPVELLARLLATLGAAPADVALGPAVGEDACVLEVAGGALVVAADPITLTTGDLGRLAVIVNANDVAVSGARPRWFLAVVLLPLGTTEPQVEQLFATMRDALTEVRATLVGGHTEVTSAVHQPIIVGQMLGLAEDGRFLATAGAAPGEVVVQVGPVPIEGAAVLATEAADRLGAVPPDVVAAARRGLREPGISVVDAALAARDLGATAMHDPTEGGLASGLHELATAAGTAIRIHPDEVHWFEPGIQVCRALGADPWATLASGSLLATFPPAALATALATLSRIATAVAAIGVVEHGHGIRTDGGTVIPWPERDEVVRVLASASPPVPPR